MKNEERKTTYELTMEFASILIEEVRNTYNATDFSFCVIPAERVDVQVAVMDCNEFLAQMDYPCYVEEICVNIDGFITFACRVDKENNNEDNKEGEEN